MSPACNSIAQPSAKVLLAKTTVDLGGGAFPAGKVSRTTIFTEPTARHQDVSHRFGTRLRELRRARKLTQVEMAVDLGINRSYISDVECGKKGISLVMLEVIALGLQMKLSDLFLDI